MQGETNTGPARYSERLTGPGRRPANDNGSQQEPCQLDENRSQQPDFARSLFLWARVLPGLKTA